MPLPVPCDIFMHYCADDSPYKCLFIIDRACAFELDSDLLVWVVDEHALKLTQQLDPKSEGRGVLQFKTALKSIIKVSTLESSCTAEFVSYRTLFDLHSFQYCFWLFF